MTREAPTADELLEHAGFLKRLAYTLIGDEHRAEDVVQQAYAAALERPPRESRSLRAWLAIVVSNLARNERRGGERRATRERALAREERVEPGELALETLEVQRALIECVVALPEEQRTVLYLRYYEGLTPTAIAARLGEPVKTIKTRHTRAVGELRVRLDERSGGDRQAWVSALLPWLRAAAAPAAASSSALLVKAVAAIALVTTAGFGWWRLARQEARGPTLVADAARREEPAHGSSPSSREPVAVTNATAPAVPATFSVVLTGTVRLREDGNPVAGAKVEAFVAGRSRSAAPSANTDAEGRFRIEWPEPVTIGSIEVRASSGAAASVCSYGSRLSAGATDVDLWVTRGARLAATVVDEAGAPVAGALVEARCAAYYDPTRPSERSAVSARDGSFALEHLGEAFVLSAKAPGLVCTSGLRGKLAPGAEASGLTLTMSAAGELRGHVVDANGRPVAGAILTVSESMTSSNRDSTRVPGVTRFSPVDLRGESGEDGAFVLGPVPSRTIGVRTTHPLFLDHDQSLSPLEADNRVELDAGCSLEGRVTAWTGEPAAGAKVTVRSTDASWRQTVSAADGAFELRALRAGENAFVLLEAEDSALFARQPLVLLEDRTPFLDLRLEPPAPLAGRVLDADGRAVADALVHVEGERVIHYDDVDFGVKTTLEWALDANEARTDPEGRFRFPNLYAGSFGVRVSPADEPRLWTELVADAGREDLEIRLDRAAMERVVFVGQVFDAYTRSPVQQFTVVPMRLEDDSARGNQFPFGPEAGGRFRLPGFEPGRYALYVQAVGYATHEGEPCELREGETAIEVALLPACAIELVVRNEQGGLLDRPARMRFEDLDGRELRIECGQLSSSSIDVGQDPRAVSGLPRAPVRLTATSPGYRDALLDLDLTVPPVDPIEVRLVRESGGELVDMLLTVLVTDERNLAGIHEGESIRDAYVHGSVRLAETDVRLEFLDDGGELVAQGRLSPLGDGRFRAELELRRERRSSESMLDRPILDGAMPVRACELVVRAEGCREERVRLALQPGRMNQLWIVLLRQGSR